MPWAPFSFRFIDDFWYHSQEQDFFPYHLIKIIFYNLKNITEEENIWIRLFDAAGENLTFHSIL